MRKRCTFGDYFWRTTIREFLIPEQSELNSGETFIVSGFDASRPLLDCIALLGRTYEEGLTQSQPLNDKDAETDASCLDYFKSGCTFAQVAKNGSLRYETTAHFYQTSFISASADLFLSIVTILDADGEPNESFE